MESTQVIAFSVGRTQVVKVPELDLNSFTATQLLPALDPHSLGSHPEWVLPGTYDADGGYALLSIHTWLIRHEGRIILLDTGAGNDKPRPTLKVLDHLHQPYLERLAAAGVQPGEVDYILLTHIHADHVGWNTSLGDGRWAPTFPNATVVCSGLEWRYRAALSVGDEAGIGAARDEAGLGQPIRIPTPGVFDDSMRPVEAAGKLRLVEVDGEEVLPGIRFLSAPGHSIDHAAIEITSDGDVGLFGGDVMHHLLEVYDPELVSMFCEFPDAARRSRREILERAAESRALYFSSHFPLSSAGYVGRAGDGYNWTFAEADALKTS